MTESLTSGDQHRTVLLQEAVDALAIQDARRDGIYIDATFGRGGHSRLILSQLSARGACGHLTKIRKRLWSASSWRVVMRDLALRTTASPQ